MGITRSMANMGPEERREYMRALRARQTAPVGFASNSELARQAQAKSVAIRRARRARTRQHNKNSAITESDGNPQAQDS